MPRGFDQPREEIEAGIDALEDEFQREKRKACPHRTCPTPTDCRTDCQCAMQKS